VDNPTNSAPTVEPAPKPADVRGRLAEEIPRLDRVSFGILVLLIPKKWSGDSELLSVPERAKRLIEWAEGANGPGLDAVADALTRLRNPVLPQIRRMVGGLGKVLHNHPRAFAAGGGGSVVLGATIWMAWVWIHPGVHLDAFVRQVKAKDTLGDWTALGQFKGEKVHGTCVITEVSPASDGTGSYLYARSLHAGDQNDTILLEINFDHNIDLTPLMEPSQKLWLRGRIDTIKDGKFKPNSKQKAILKIKVESYRKVE